MVSDFWPKYWANRQSGGHRSQNEDFLHREGLEKLFHLGCGTRLLDFGCGSCDLTVYYAQKFSEVVGVDFSDSMLAAGRRRLASKEVVNVTLVSANNQTVWQAVPGHFDIVTNSGVIQYFTEGEIRAFVEAARLRLTDNGRMVFFDVVDPLRYQLRLFLNLFNADLRTCLGRTAGLGMLFALFVYYRVIGSDKPADKLGRKYGHKVFERIAGNAGLSASFVNSMYYDYRYHVILEPLPLR